MTTTNAIDNILALVDLDGTAARTAEASTTTSDADPAEVVAHATAAAKRAYYNARAADASPDEAKAAASRAYDVARDEKVADIARRATPAAAPFRQRRATGCTATNVCSAPLQRRHHRA